MFASSIGKIFLKEYNRRKGTNYSAKEFFEKEFYPLFYDHPKHMLWVHNSPFFQLKEKANAEKRAEAFEKLKSRISNKDIDGSVAVGFFSNDTLATTSGQVTGIEFPLDENEIYYSWIGGGFAVAVEGILSIYFIDEKILWVLYEGWAKYRQFLNQLDMLQPTQIDRWNAKWLIHYYSDDKGFLFDPTELATNGGLEIVKPKWTEVLFAIANGINESVITGYVFRLYNTNITVGYIPFHLPDIRKPVQFYTELFGENEYLNNAKLIRSLYGTAFGFLTACQMGVIGVRALEPKDLQPYMAGGQKKGKMPNYEKADQAQQISFKIYQTWLLAMLDNKQLWEKATKAANAYLLYESEAKKLTTKNIRQVEEVFDSASKRKFIEANIPIIEKGGKAANELNSLVEEVNSMPEDNFRYFLTLIKFRYKFLQSQKKIEL